MGDNFGLNDSYDYFEFELDSLDATSTGKTNASSTDWPSFEIAGKGPIKNIAAMKILEAQIPFSYYIFNPTNCTFLLTETFSSALVTATVTLPIGNFNADELVLKMAAALSAVSPNSYTYTVVYNHNLQKFIFYNNNSSTTNPFTFTFGAGYGLTYPSGTAIQPNSGNTNPRLYIGFPPGATTSQTFTTGAGTPSTTNMYGNTLLSPNVESVSGPNYLYINSTSLGPDFDLFLPKGAFNLGGGTAGPQICKIPVTTQPGGVLYWSDPDSQKWFSVKGMADTLSRVDFYLSLGNTTSQLPLQLNGLPFSLKVGVLTTNNTHSEQGGGLAMNDRVYRRDGPKRIRSTY